MVSALFSLIGAVLSAFSFHAEAPAAIPTPAPKPFTAYAAPSIPKKQTYLMVMVGDSMTNALGPHGGSMNPMINDRYKETGSFVEIDNYARPSTSILSFPDVWNTPTKSFDVTFPPLKDRDFDLMLIESYGYNPLSQYQPDDEGLKRQNEALDQILTTVTTTHPHAAVMFVATIAPNKNRFGYPINPGESPENRAKEVASRMRYIENHINYAHAHGIPVIDIYDKTRDANGNGMLANIDPNDYIHPSGAGVDLIGAAIADAVWDANVLPH